MKATLTVAILGCLLARVAGAQDGADPGVRFEFGTTLNAVLSDSIDARKNKPGDVIKARASEDVKVAGAVVIPRGTRLLGRVREVEAGSESDGRALLRVTFDRAELKDGRAIALHAGVYALAAPKDAPDSNGSSSGDGFGGGFGGGSASIGSIVSNSGHAAADDRSALGTRGSSKSDEFLKPSPGAIGGVNSNGSLYASSRGVFGIEDVNLERDTSAGVGGAAIVSTGRGVHLPSGTRLLLCVESVSATASTAAESNKS